MTSVGKNIELEPLHTIDVMQNSVATLKSSVEVTQKYKKLELPYDPAIPLLGIYPKLISI